MKWIKSFKESLKPIHWHKTVGLNKDRTKYAVDFVSSPLSQEQFNKIGGRFVKQAFGDVDKEFVVGFKFALPKELVDKNQLGLKLALPKISIGSYRVASKEVVGVSYELKAEGWVITQEVEGSLKV